MQAQAAQEFASTVKDGFTQGVSFLKRRFSSSDLIEDSADKPATPPIANQPRPSRPPPPARRQTVDLSAEDSKTVSAPTSPSAKAQTRPDAVQRSDSQGTSQRRMSYNPEKCKCLLIIDDGPTNWRNYFHGRKLIGDHDIRVEQTDFRGILMITSNAEGCFAHTTSTKMAKIDFALIRQSPPADRNDNWRKVITGLLYGGVPGLNSIQSIYNFSDRTWVFSHLLMLQRKLGKENFPLIEQSYTLGCDQLTSAAPLKYPVVVKVGQAVKGVGKMKVQNPTDLLDLESVLALHNDFATVEPYVDVVFEISVQKIGPYYKSIKKKRKNTYWKNSLTASQIEQVTTTEKHKNWIDEISQLFGGLDICSLSTLVSSEGNEFIYKVSDSTCVLAVDSKEDMQHVAELTFQKMNSILAVKHPLQQKDSSNALIQNQQQSLTKRDSIDSIKRSKEVIGPGSRPPPPPPPQQQPNRRNSGTDEQQRRQPPPTLPQQMQQQQGNEEIAEDTMGNLKKTFAGIFGDM